MKRIWLLLLLNLTAATLSAQPALRVRSYPEHGIVYLAWTPVVGASYYKVRRAAVFPNWETNASETGSNTWSPVYAPATGTGCVYRVEAYDSQNQLVGGTSNIALVTSGSFSEAIVAGETEIKATHVTELRSRINAARHAAGLSTIGTWQTVVAAGGVIEDQDVLDLRAALNAALVNIGYAAPAYDDPVLEGLPVEARHFEQLRSRSENYPELVTPLTNALSEAYFSPNADSVKDVTTYAASVRSTTRIRWQVNVRNSANAVVRSWSGLGSGLSVTWDGRNAASQLQPDAVYTFEMFDLDGPATPIASAAAVLDNTPPLAAISSPSSGAVISNVRGPASGVIDVTGSTSDANFSSWDLVAVDRLPAIASGTTPLAAGTLIANWQTLSVANGVRTLRLTGYDRAGNKTASDAAVTIGHFSSSQNTHQINLALQQPVTYTSVVPFPLTQTLTIRNATGTVVRTLVDASRTAGTYSDVWTGLNDAGVLVADGPYTYTTTAVENNNTVTLDATNEPVGAGATQYRYPFCRAANGSSVSCDGVATDFDPWALKPLVIQYCVDQAGASGAAPPACGGSLPAFVIIKRSVSNETSAACDSGCIFRGYQPSGYHSFDWFGLHVDNGTIVTGKPYMTVIRNFDGVAKNMTLAFGTAPVVSNVTVAPLVFNPESVSTPQMFTMTIAAYQNRTVSLTAQFRNRHSGSVLRTVPVPAAPAGTLAIGWDGRAENGALVAPGDYEVTITVIDSVGGTATTRLLIQVQYL